MKEIKDEQKKVAVLFLSLMGEPKTFFSNLLVAQTDWFAHAKAAIEERFQEKPASDETSQQRVWKALHELVLGQNQLNQTIAAM